MYNVLWVDDEFDTSMKTTLEKAKQDYKGCINFEIASDFNEFKTVFNRGPVWDALILDINIPLDKNDTDNNTPTLLIDSIFNEFKEIQEWNIPRFAYSGMPDLKGGSNASAKLRNLMASLKNYGFQKNVRHSSEKAFYWDKQDLDENDGKDFIFKDVCRYLEENNVFKGHISLYNIYNELRQKGFKDASDTIKNLVRWKNKEKDINFPAIYALRESLNKVVSEMLPDMVKKEKEKGDHNLITYAYNVAEDPFTKATIGWLKNINSYVHDSKDKNNTCVDPCYYDIFFIATEKLCELVWRLMEGGENNQTTTEFESQIKEKSQTGNENQIKDKFIFIEENGGATVTLYNGTSKTINYVPREKGSIVKASTIRDEKLFSLNDVPLPEKGFYFDICMTLHCIINSIKIKDDSEEKEKMIERAKLYRGKAKIDGIGKDYLDALNALIKVNENK